MANNAGGGSFTLMDYDRETSTMNFATGPITVATLPAALTQFGALRTAIQGITVGTVAAESLYVNRTKLSNTPPADPHAQRERKWLVTYEDATEYFDAPTNSIPNAGFGKVFNVEIPTADFGIADILLPNSGDANLTLLPMSQFITAFENLVHSPYNGAVSVIRIQAIGRST